MMTKKNPRYVHKGKDGVVRYLDYVPDHSKTHPAIKKDKRAGKPFYEDTGCAVTGLSMLGMAVLRVLGKI